MEYKTAEKMLKEAGITGLTEFHNYDYLYRSIKEVIHSYASQAVRLALEEAASKCETTPDGSEFDWWENRSAILGLESSILSRLK